MFDGQQDGTAARGAAAGIGAPKDAFTTALGWSFTRHTLLHECERAAFWQYWGAREGWRRDAPDDARRAYALKHLTAVPLLLGQAVHDAAREVVVAVRDARPRPTYDALLAGARAQLNRVWRASQPDRLGRFWRWPTHGPVLHEIVYQGRLPAAASDSARVRLASCLRHLLGARLLHDLAACRPDEIVLGDAGPERVLVDVPPWHRTAADQGADAVARADAPDGSRPSMATVWVALDLQYRHHAAEACLGLKDGAGVLAGERRPSGPCWCVVDFKTGIGHPALEALQLAVGALALEARGYPPTDDVYLGRLVNLRTGCDSWYALDATDLARARALVAADVDRQLVLVRAALAGGAAASAADAFAVTADPRRCPRCNFFALCGDAPAGPAPGRWVAAGPHSPLPRRASRPGADGTLVTPVSPLAVVQEDPRA